MAGKRTGYSLAEIILVVIIVGVLTLIAVPRLNLAVIHHKQGDAAAKKIITDLRRARTLAISNAANNQAGFRLQMTGSSPYNGYQIVDANSGTVTDSQTISSPVSCSGGSQFKFGPLGNLLSGSDTSLSVSADGKTYTITVINATGIVEYTGG